MMFLPNIHEYLPLAATKKSIHETFTAIYGYLCCVADRSKSVFTCAHEKSAETTFSHGFYIIAGEIVYKSGGIYFYYTLVTH